MAPRNTRAHAQDAPASDHEYDEATSAIADDDDQSEFAPTSVRWETIVKVLPEFSGARPLHACTWLEQVAKFLERAGIDPTLRVASARMRLKGEAADELGEWLGDDWDEFSSDFLDLFDPVGAAHEIVEAIHARKRYVGLPSITKAVILAVNDRAGIRKATGDDLARPILLALHALLPPTTITAAGLNIGGDFHEEIAVIRRQIGLAKIRSDSGARWAKAEAVTQAFAASPTAKNPPTGDRRRHRRRADTPTAMDADRPSADF
ncbi:hypothetical protein LPJ61_004448 [Coemansia biformis]|uniref:Uncharacterized protein n=1 Tax=Coemansia biformis TaxID=1286918 RepID=A0A9W7Y4T6_9FUNG|nr:hypothetical protein LPJ61_004448 [Coemansia biformis]